MYTVNLPPSNATVQELATWALQEIQGVSNILLMMKTQQVEELSVAPSKPRTGMVVLADGVRWNPGSGRGYYGYDAAIGWRFLG